MGAALAGCPPAAHCRRPALAETRGSAASRVSRPAACRGAGETAARQRAEPRAGWEGTKNATV